MAGPPSRIPQLRSEDVRDLESAGVAIGNHTLTHPCLPRCTDDVLRQEIVQAHEKLTALLTTAPEAFAYPNGDWDPRAEACLAGLGYRSGFVFDHRISRLPLRNPLRVSRVRVNSSTSLDRFELILSGLHPVLHRLRGGV
jgi:peptidoglycan/xylan/chitin deacetylase (PgdA/CDA1 family)